MAGEEPGQADAPAMLDRGLCQSDQSTTRPCGCGEPLSGGERSSSSPGPVWPGPPPHRRGSRPGWIHQPRPRGERFLGAGQPGPDGRSGWHRGSRLRWWSSTRATPRWPDSESVPHAGHGRAAGRAVAAAAEADVAVVFAGTTEEWETEGNDRPMFELPGRQPSSLSGSPPSMTDGGRGQCRHSG